MSNFNRVIGHIDKYPIVSLFPYQIKNREKFIHRDHPPIDKDNPQTIAHYREQWKRIVEGLWVLDEDEEGNSTWVFMMPKLYFYVNCGTINKEDASGQRYDGPPDLRDNEWISASYTLCYDGFSGFENDPDYTCNDDIRRVEEGEELTPYEKEALVDQSVLKEDGTYKKYVNAWDYLTVTYLIEDPRPFSLGKPLYWNGSYNAMHLASRKYGKTYWLSGGDFVHEFITNGVREVRYLDRRKRKSKISLFVGTADKKHLETFMTVAELSWRNVPGKSRQMASPLFRDAVGVWNADRAQITQGYRPLGSTEIVGSGSEIANAIIQPNKAEIVVSRRSRRINVDEVGLVKNIIDVHDAAEGTLRATGKQSGSLVGSGTGGNIDAIQQTKEMSTDPIRFNIYPVPNYWKDNRPFCLFTPVTYTEDKYKDKNGNTDLHAATAGVLADRHKKSGGDLSKITKHRQNFPIIPDEMFLAGKSDYFSKDVIIDRIQLLEDGLWEKQAKLFDLTIGPERREGGYEVIAKQHYRYDNVIRTIFASDIKDRTGELVVYEEPKPHPTDYAHEDSLYKVVLDPVSDKTTGRSYVGIVVYKGYPMRETEPGEIVNNIVATFKGRREDEENHRMAMLLCLWYKCKLQFENNVGGVGAFFDKHSLGGLIQPPPFDVIKDNIKSTTQGKDRGVAISYDLKVRLMRALKFHHNQVVRRDEAGRDFRWIEDCYDLALLYEMNFYDEDTNVDLISAMLILMLWLEQERKYELPGGNNAASESFKELANLAEIMYDGY